MQKKEIYLKSEEERWEPNPKNEAIVRKEIESRFDRGRKSNLENPTVADWHPDRDGRVPAVRPDKAFIDACAKVGSFLMDKEAVTKQLKRLNSLLQKKIEEIGKTSITVKILRETLEEELGKLGFHAKFGKTFGNVQPDAFRAALAHGLMLKDAVLGNQAHGEFSHAIQWLIIAWQQQDSNFIGRPAVDVFKRLGEEESVFEREAFYENMSIDARRREEGIWDIIVDKSAPDDFRSPAVLNKFIENSTDNELGLLKKLLTARTQKRKEKGNYEKLKEQYDKPKVGFYHKGKLPLIHEPITSDIDLKKFRKKNS